MTQEDILRMARESWKDTDPSVDSVAWYQNLERFASLIAAAEREACADICDQHASVDGIAQRCAEQIRARGKT